MEQEKLSEDMTKYVVRVKTQLQELQKEESGAELGKNCAIFVHEPAQRKYAAEVAHGPRGGQEKNSPVWPQTAEADQDIVVSKWIGLEGTALLVKKQYQRLRERFPLRILEEAAGFDKYLSVIPEAATAMKSGVCGIYTVSRGGIFAGLWEMAKEAGVGLEVDLRKIPVRQETIEICEFLEENPYELLSGGCLLMTAKNGNVLAEAVCRENIPAVVVGRTTKGNDKILYHEGKKRYLNRPGVKMNL